MQWRAAALLFMNVSLLTQEWKLPRCQKLLINNIFINLK